MGRADCGEITLSNGRVFRWIMSGTHVLEVYGSVSEETGQIVPGSSGWWRTDDPVAAGRAAEAQFGGEI